ncbi:MAG: hypothetical protein WBN88_20760 [Anderseniella sp.]
MNKPELHSGQSNPTLQLAKTAVEAALAGRKKQEWKPPSDTCKTVVTLDYLASFHSSV